MNRVLSFLPKSAFIYMASCKDGGYWNPLTMSLLLILMTKALPKKIQVLVSITCA